jgi:hypothetical protein
MGGMDIPPWDTSSRTQIQACKIKMNEKSSERFLDKALQKDLHPEC